MDIRTLQYFLAVAREQNITRAAETLYIGQPALSKQLSDLEKELGRKLFDRGKRKTTLTEDGILFYKRAEEILSLIERTQVEFASDSGMIAGEIAIGGGPSNFILQSISQLASLYPDLRFYLHSGDALDVINRLDHGSLDFAVLMDPIDILKYESMPLPETDQWGFLMRADCPLAQKNSIEKEDILSLPIIAHKRPQLLRELALWANTEINKLNIVATYNTLFSNPSLLVKHNLGYAFVMKNSVYAPENSEICFRPLSPDFLVHYNLVWKRYSTLSKATTTFIDYLKANGLSNHSKN